MAAAPTTVQELLHLLVRSGLVTREWLTAYLRKAADARASTPAELAARLQSDGALTAFQAGQLLAGKWRGFFLGKYRILQPIGSGSMGRVLLAEHTVMNRRVALKVLPPGAVGDLATVQRFQREGRAIASLDHPNIVRAYDMGQEDGQVYLAMEYVEGQSLAAVVERDGPMPVARAADCVRQACLGLQHIHDAGWVHRDIKPSNLLLTPAGVVKVLDLGLARSTVGATDHLTRALEARFILGTLDYLSPEQARQSSDIDGRSDLYSLGATFYFLLTGQPPFASGLVAEKLVSHLSESPRPVRELRPEVPEVVAAVLHRMLAKGPEQRYQKASEVAAALAAGNGASALGAARSAAGGFQAERPARERPRPPGVTTATAEGTPRKHGRNRWVVPVCVGVGVLALAAGGVALAGALLWSPRVEAPPDGAAQKQERDTKTQAPPAAPAAAAEKALSPAEARERVGQSVRLVMKVESAGESNSGTMYFLNSERDFKARSNFTLVIPKRILQEEDVDLAALRRKYLGKRVQTAGKVTRYNNLRPQIEIEDLRDLQVLTGH